MENNLERTDVSNQFYKGMIQAILGEEPHVTDPIAREDIMFYRLGELCSEENDEPPIITQQEAMECWLQYIHSVRPDVRVIHLGQVISERARFYE